ncbi:MAG: adenylate kinase [Anaerolineae bacterium CG_4_9_14_0_8_um_filter_58_9]|nr:MAG: adenylate kinase [Anaerolineae bacterium CG_4_9_14_0_8_um_filter_58_9]
MAEPFPYRRIAVVGTTGSGKSTLAESIAHRLHIPHVELDALFWQPDWKETPQEVMRPRVEAFTRGPAWVTDGNYSFCRDLIWSRAQAVIWLDYTLPLILWRLWRRTWQRALQREILWETNYERLWPQFFSKDSIFLWALQTYGRRRKNYAALYASGTYPHLKLYHFKSPREMEAWLRSWDSVSGC